MRGTVLDKVSRVLDDLPFPQLQINSRKTVFGSKAHRRRVTGLILSNDGSVSLGRDRKRCIRAQIHHFAIGRLDGDQQLALRGMIAFARSIEPGFVSRMEKKYGREVIDRIREGR